MSEHRGGRSISFMHAWFFDGYEEVDYVDKGGKLRTRLEYHGKIYGFSMEKTAMTRLRLTYLALLLLGYGLIVLGMLHMSPLAARLPGALLALVLVPQFYYTVGYVRFLLLKEEFNNRRMHQSCKRMEYGVLAKLGVGGLSLLLSLLFLFLKAELTWETDNLITLGCSLGVCLIAVAECLLVNRNRYKLLRDRDKVVENADPEKGELEAQKKPRNLEEYLARQERDRQEAELAREARGGLFYRLFKKRD